MPWSSLTPLREPSHYCHPGLCRPKLSTVYFWPIAGTDLSFHLSGSYREVQPPERLVYTWCWERPEMDIGETLVTVEFRDLGASTEVVVTHDLFPSQAACDQHQGGWSGCLDRLPEAL